jgi:PRC-barrel domain protein
MPITDDAVQMRGMTAVASDRDKLGTIEDIYLDRESGEPEWMTLKTGLSGGHLSFVPLAEARRDGDTIAVPYDKATVRTLRASTPTASSPRARRPACTATTGSTTRSAVRQRAPRGRRCGPRLA